MRPKEKRLWQRIVKGEKSAFREFYEQTYERLLELTKKKTRSVKDAQEVVHDVYLSFLDSLPVFEGNSSLKTFLYAIWRHEVADYWRKRYAKKAIRIVPFVDQVYTERLYSAKRTAMLIEKVYASIKPWEEKVLKWKYEEGWSVKQIAEEMGWSIKAAESRLFRARQAFQTAYTEVDGG